MTSSFKPIVGEVLLYGDKCLILFVFCMVITAFLCLFYSALIEKMHSWLEKEKKPITQILRFMASSQLVCNKFIAMLLGIQQPLPFFFISLGDRLVHIILVLTFLLFWTKSTILMIWSLPFATLKMRGKLGQVNFRKNFFRGGKNWPIADRRVPSNDSRNNCGTYFGSSSLLIFVVVDGYFCC